MQHFWVNCLFIIFWWYSTHTGVRSQLWWLGSSILKRSTFPDLGVPLCLMQKFCWSLYLRSLTIHYNTKLPRPQLYLIHGILLFLTQSWTNFRSQRCCEGCPEITLVDTRLHVSGICEWFAISCFRAHIFMYILWVMLIRKLLIWLNGRMSKLSI